MTVHTAPPITADQAWAALLLVKRAGRGDGLEPPLGLVFGHDGRPRLAPPERADLVARPDGSWTGPRPLLAEAATLLELHLAFALAGPERPMIVAHLGQSIDGRIATQNGHSRYVTGAENIAHMHRMRALADAVLVGAQTVRHDNPQLTTRLVDGDSPTRVVLDPRRRLGTRHRLFSDAVAPTLMMVSRPSTDPQHGTAELIVVGQGPAGLDLNQVVAQLRRRGLNALFVEGGGVTVSGFLQARLLDCLQVTVAPIILGSGRPGIALPTVASMSDALRPPCRTFGMGQDVLFQFSLGVPARRAQAASREDRRGLRSGVTAPT